MFFLWGSSWQWCCSWLQVAHIENGISSSLNLIRQWRVAITIFYIFMSSIQLIRRNVVLCNYKTQREHKLQEVSIWNCTKTSILKLVRQTGTHTLWTLTHQERLMLARAMSVWAKAATRPKSDLPSTKPLNLECPQKTYVPKSSVDVDYVLITNSWRNCLHRARCTHKWTP